MGSILLETCNRPEIYLFEFLIVFLTAKKIIVVTAII